MASTEDISESRQNPGKISRIFFGKPEERASTLDSYGAPLAPSLNSYNPSYPPTSGNSGYGPNPGNTGYNPNPGYNDPGYFPNTGFNDVSGYTQLDLTLRLGQAALIAFIILAIVLVAFILLKCCIHCSTFCGAKQSHHYDQENGRVWTQQSNSSESFLSPSSNNKQLGNNNNTTSHLTGEKPQRSQHKQQFAKSIKEDKSSSDSLTSQSNPRSLPYYEISSPKMVHQPGLPDRAALNTPLPPIPSHEMSKWSTQGRLV